MVIRAARAATVEQKHFGDEGALRERYVMTTRLPRRAYRMALVPRSNT